MSWVVGSGRWPDGGSGAAMLAAITPKGFAPPGAPLAVARQGADELDTFVVGNDGAVYVTWVGGLGPWSGPTRITPPGLAPAGACLTAASQNANQLDVFFVGRDGSVYLTWVVQQGHWSDGAQGNLPPARITPAGQAKPGSCVAAGKPSPQAMDAFVVGVDGTLWRTFETGDGRWSDGGVGPGVMWPAGLTQAVWMRRCWPCWPHIHGSPVFAAFPGGPSFLYVWPEKDHLKAFRWLGAGVDVGHPILASDQAGKLALSPPGPPFGMPGGMLAVSADPGTPPAGIVFASVPRPEGMQMDGELRAFDPFTLRELWNNAGTIYRFAKFVPPTIWAGRVFLPTGSGAVLVYGLRL